MRTKIYRFTSVNMASFCIAYIIMFRTLGNVAIVGFGSGLLNNIFLALLFAIVGGTFFLKAQNRGSMNGTIVITITFILIAYALYVMIDEVQLNGVELLIYCIFPLLIADIKIDTELVLRYVLYMSLLELPVLNKLFEYQYNSFKQIDMATAYALFIGVVATVVHFLFYKEKKNCFLICAYAMNLYILIRLLFEANRGIYLSIATLIILTQIIYVQGREYSLKKKRFWKRILFFEIVVGLLLLVNLNYIILYLYDVLLEMQQKIPSFLLKMRRQILAGDVSNGRTELYKFIILKILNNPLGYGLESTYRISGGLYSYPHNYILQFLTEFGWIIGSILTYIVNLPVFLFFSKKINDTMMEKKYFLFLIVISIPKVFLSGDIWMQPQFWLLFGYGLILLKKCKKEHIKR